MLRSIMPHRTWIETVAQTIDAWKRCKVTGNEWATKHEITLKELADALPSGSGFDAQTTIDLERSHLERVIIHTSFHHMDENGYYDGWTEHTLTVTPSFLGHCRTRISGLNRNDIKSYIAEVFSEIFTAKVDYVEGHYRIVAD